MPPLNPYESPTLPAAPPPPPLDVRRTGRWLRGIVWLQLLGLVAMTLISLADIRMYGLSLPGPVGVALAIPAAFTAIMLLWGPFLWLWVLSKSLWSPQSWWWFVLLEPILWGATWFVMLPTVQ